MADMTLDGPTRSLGRPVRALRAAALLGAVLGAATAGGARPYTGPPDPSSGESEHGKGG